MSKKEFLQSNPNEIFDAMSKDDFLELMNSLGFQVDEEGENE